MERKPTTLPRIDAAQGGIRTWPRLHRPARANVVRNPPALALTVSTLRHQEREEMVAEGHTGQSRRFASHLLFW